MTTLDAFCEIWLCDFEFRSLDGEQPEPICLVAREFRSGKLIRLWRDEFGDSPPFDTGSSTMFVAYYASAELGCFLALDWEMPVNILDLYVEFRCQTSGLQVPCGRGLLGALTFHGLPAIDAAEKDKMRELALRGEPYTTSEKTALLDYCQSDVDGLARLLPAMMPTLDLPKALPRALVRGWYMKAVAKMERRGVPIDGESLNTLRTHWDSIKSKLITAVDADFGVFVPTNSRLDPATATGQAIVETAKEWELDPHQLADAVDSVYCEERDSTIDQRNAREAARGVTGLTAAAINRWEDSGKDYSSWPDLDDTARELAGQYPDLGIGEGFSLDTGVDDTDHAGNLWEVLRNRNESVKPRSHPDILHQAAEMLRRSPTRYTGPMTFSTARWAGYLQQHGYPWPRLTSGALDLSDDCFREMARRYPAVATIRELRHTLSQLRLHELTVGKDSHNRCLLSPFGSRTGRNQPSNARFIFGPSVWLRSLIRPTEGRALAYIDWSQQEFGIAAALSSDPAMMAAYQSGDPYLTFAKQADAVPADATRESHKVERERFKVCALAVQYGMGSESLARRLGTSPAQGRELIRRHRETYPTYWQWSDAVENTAMLSLKLQTAFGWTVHVRGDANPRSLRNFPLQANGAEMLRLAAILSTESGLPVCAPVHDAFLVEAPEPEIESVVARMQTCMRQASELVLPGFPLRTDASIVRWPDRYSDPRGQKFWETVWEVLDRIREPVVQFGDTSVTKPSIRCLTS
jgi:hypothetical protein